MCHVRPLVFLLPGIAPVSQIRVVQSRRICIICRLFFFLSLSCSLGRHTSYEQSLALPTNDDDDMLFTMLTSALF